MPDLPDPPLEPAHPETQRRCSPPLTPPSPDATEPDQKLSRKREREVSLEPVSTPKASDADTAIGTEHRDIRTPAKRNRRHLESTKEEVEDATSKSHSRSRSRSHSVSPPLGVGVSPRQEIKIKVRQISQGVEDLSWKGVKAVDKDSQIHELKVQTSLEPSAEVDEKIEVDNATISNTKPPSPTNVEKEDVQQSSNVDGAIASAPTASVNQAHLRVNLEGGEKGLKRRFGERGTSQGPYDEDGALKEPSESLKRPRDDAGEDPDSRQPKRPSPPPETLSSPRPSPPSPKIAKVGGFMAYASTSSPFASVKGQNIFTSGRNSPPSASASPAPATLPLRGAFGEPSTSPPNALKRSGFEAFASSSPFASVARSKSPVLGQTLKLGRTKSPPARSNSINSNPFGLYIGNSQGFAIPAQKRARAGSPTGSSRSSLERNSTISVLESNRSESSEEADEDERPTSFGEKLRATKDDEDSGKSEDEPKVVLTEQEVITGEEDEETIHQVRGKLFSLSGNQWKERGTGQLKLNVKRSDGTGARLVMRKEAVYALLLNVTLFPGMRCTLAQDPRYLRFSSIENGLTSHYNLRLSNAKIAQELLEEINANIPST